MSKGTLHKYLPILARTEKIYKVDKDRLGGPAVYYMLPEHLEEWTEIPPFKLAPTEKVLKCIKGLNGEGMVQFDAAKEFLDLTVLYKRITRVPGVIEVFDNIDKPSFKAVRGLLLDAWNYLVLRVKFGKEDPAVILAIDKNYDGLEKICLKDFRHAFGESDGLSALRLVFTANKERAAKLIQKMIEIKKYSPVTLAGSAEALPNGILSQLVKEVRKSNTPRGRKFLEYLGYDKLEK